MKKNIVITILSILVIGLGCFIIYDKVINKEESKNNIVVDEVKLESLSLDSDIVQTLYSYVSFSKLLDNYSNLDSLFYDDKLQEQLSNTDLLAENFTDKLVLNITLRSSQSFYRAISDEEQNYYAQRAGYHENDVKSLIKRIFGSERENKINIKELIAKHNDNFMRYIYDEENSIIDRYIMFGGFSMYISTTSELVKAETDNENIYIYEDVSVHSAIDETTTNYTIKYTYKNNNGDYTFYRLQSYKR